MKTPTYEEWEKAVSREYRTLCDERDFKNYYSSDEAQETIKAQYSDNVARFKRGDITRREFMEGGVNSCAWCLMLMTE